MSDSELIQRYHDTRDPAALDALIRRYLPLVYSSAHRQVRDAHLAADVTQAVFIVLVRKIDALPVTTELAGWLFTVTRHAVANAMRIAKRRKFHEAKKAMLDARQSRESNASDAHALSAEIRSMLDDVIARLPATERSGVLMHYFGLKSHREVGAALGLSEDAARKRIGRAIEKLRTMLTARGVTTMSAGALSSALVHEATAAGAMMAHAPLASSAVNVAMLTNALSSTSAMGSTQIAQGVMHMLMLSKIKLAAAACAACVLVGTAAVPVISHARSSANNAITLSAQSAPTTAPAKIIEIADGATLEILGLSKYPPDEDSWFAMTGERIPMPEGAPRDTNMRTEPMVDHCIAARMQLPADAIMRIEVLGSRVSGVSQRREGNQADIECGFAMEDESSKTVNIRYGVSLGGWETLAGNDAPAAEHRVELEKLGEVNFYPIEAADRDGKDGSSVAIEHAAIDDPIQLVVITEQGEQICQNINVNSNGQIVTTTCTFDVPPDQVKRVLLQIRRFTKIVDLRDVSLEAGHVTKPTITVRDAKKK